MNVPKNFIFILMLFASSVFAQVTHMGVPAQNMVVLTTLCAHASTDCGNSWGGTSGITYNRIFSDGTFQEFKMPARKVLVITDYEWTYTERTVMQDSENNPLTVRLGNQIGSAGFTSVSQSTSVIP